MNKTAQAGHAGSAVRSDAWCLPTQQRALSNPWDHRFRRGATPRRNQEHGAWKRLKELQSGEGVLGDQNVLVAI